ncbi:Asp23/Gls24 family envelope stress response protein [Exiguobacterium sp. TNDT2]|uniref:Asp23/Gls24 family envelope stress response protein n=1 Tax=Exiguobacterium sp. TNDT2 TaxID=2233531 RepID=UPI000DEF149C|nr:Asp23/Gls24 family envelope stress response protein [Exiguobacterium sp. TNDT2]
MAIEMKTTYGNIDITNDVVATLAGGAAMECFGVVGMASQAQLKDGIAELLKRENYARGVVVRQDREDVHIDMHIIVSYGTRVSEVAYNVQSRVKYTLGETLGLNVSSVNIFVQGVRLTND